MIFSFAALNDFQDGIGKYYISPKSKAVLY